MNGLRSATPLCVLSSLVALGLGCRRTPPEEKVAAGDAGLTRVAAPADARAVDAAIAEEDASADDAGGASVPVHDMEAWVSSDIYDLRLESVKYCKVPVEKTDASPPPKPPLMLGAKVHVKAKTDEFFADARHASLRDGPLYIEPILDKTFGGCTPLKGKIMRKGEVASGYIVFPLPSDQQRRLILDYKPVRWGGAGLVRVEIPKLPQP